MSDQPVEPRSEQGPALPSRRRLLRAAATVAPVIATLPNGAAWANASTAQCIVTSRDTSQSASTVGVPPSNVPAFDVTTAPDNFVRAPGLETTFKRGTAPNVERQVVYSFPPDTTYYTPAGSVFNPRRWTVESTREVLLLRVFQPTSDTGDVISNPTSVDNCPTAGPIPPQCIFPVSKRDTTGDLAGNTGLAYSCLCSVNPNLISGAC
jgi:hypothetical protein